MIIIIKRSLHICIHCICVCMPSSPQIEMVNGKQENAYLYCFLPSPPPPGKASQEQLLDKVAKNTREQLNFHSLKKPCPKVADIYLSI